MIDGFLKKRFGLEGVVEKCVGCFLVYLFSRGFFIKNEGMCNNFKKHIVISFSCVFMCFYGWKGYIVKIALGSCKTHYYLPDMSLYTRLYTYNRFNHLLSSCKQDILQPRKLALYCNIIHQKGGPLLNCYGFVDGTTLQISRPKISQNIVYNGHERVHGIKFQDLALPNGFIGNLMWENGIIAPCYMSLVC